MKNMIRYISLIAFVVIITSFSYPLVEEKPKEFFVNGLKVIFKPSIKEITSVRLFIKGGTANYSKDQEGIESLALAVAVEGGTKKLTRTEFATAAEKLGTDIGY